MPEPAQRLRLSGKGIRIPIQGTSFAVEMGKQTIHLCPDLPVDSALRQPPFDFILFDPELYYSGIAHTLRLSPGQKLAIDYREESQKIVFSHYREAFRRHLQITHEGDYLVFRDPISELGTYLCLLADEEGNSRFDLHRRFREGRPVALPRRRASGQQDLDVLERPMLPDSQAQSVAGLASGKLAHQLIDFLNASL